MSYKDFLNLKPGDSVTVLNNPNGWSSAAGGMCGVNIVDYPYTMIVKNIVWRQFASISHIAILDTNGYGWAIDNELTNIFKIDSILNVRKSKINNLNID